MNRTTGQREQVAFFLMINGNMGGKLLPDK